VTREALEVGDVTLACDVVGEGPLVIAAHGFPDGATTFRAQVPALVRAGYRVVVPTLRGYAPSGVARSGRHDALALAADLIALADRYSPGAPARLIGHDWGAVAGFAAVHAAPSRFSHFVAMAIPHLRAALPRLLAPAQMRRSWYIGLFQLPRLAEARLAADDFALIDRLWRDWSPGYRATPEELRAVKDGIRDRIGPVLGYYRALPRLLASPSRRALLAPVRVPTLRLHGEDDGCVGVDSAEGEERWYEGPFDSQRIDGAGHFLHREKPEMVNAAVLSFFRAREQG
jgi:pimeloyl-ACP methyl ester carboxylesterase